MGNSVSCFRAAKATSLLPDHTTVCSSAQLCAPTQYTMHVACRLLLLQQCAPPNSMVNTKHPHYK